MTIVKESAPHLRRNDSLFRMFLDVIIALTPVIIFAYVGYTWAAVRNLLIPSAIMIAAEFVSVILRNPLPIDGKPHTFKERLKFGCSKWTINNLMAPLISGLIFGLLMPAETNPSGLIYVALVAGSLFGIIIGKLVFGGTGHNIFNPAAVGMVFAKLCFGSSYVYTAPWFGGDIAVGGTALTTISGTSADGGGLVHYASLGQDYSLLDLLIGRCPGVIGETCKIAILVGLVYLLIRRAIDWRVIVAYLGSFILLSLVAGLAIVLSVPGVNFLTFLGYEILSGGLLFGAVYMLTDPVTMPVTSPGRIFYGFIAASITLLIRLFGSYPEGVVFSILLVNALAPFIDYYKWSSQLWTRKRIILISCLGTIMILVLVLGILFSGKAVA